MYINNDDTNKERKIKRIMSQIQMKILLQKNFNHVMYVWSERENKVIKKTGVAAEDGSQAIRVDKPNDIIGEDKNQQFQ